MDRVLLPVLLVIIFSSCKSNLENISLDDVQKHRNFQDSIFKNVTKLDTALVKIDSLVEAYNALKIERKENNSNYYYYLGRIYNRIDYIPLNGNFYDSLNKKTNNIEVLKKYRKYALENYEKSFEINPNQVNSFNNILSLFLHDLNTMPLLSNTKQLLMTQSDFQRLFNLVINNAIRVALLDTTADLYFKKKITQASFILLDGFYFRNGYNNLNLTLSTPNDELRACEILGMLAEIIKNNNTYDILNRSYFKSQYSLIKNVSSDANLILKKKMRFEKMSEDEKMFMQSYLGGYVCNYTTNLGGATISQHSELEIQIDENNNFTYLIKTITQDEYNSNEPSTVITQGYIKSKISEKTGLQHWVFEGEGIGNNRAYFYTPDGEGFNKSIRVWIPANMKGFSEVSRDYIKVN
jgi:hypothetical protein